MANSSAKSLLGDLGKSTLRGVRKCHKCGIYNGTRSLHCKNTACAVVFKEGSRRATSSATAVRVNTGAGSQELYSVRLRDRGPDYRGFVQINPGDDESGLLNPTEVCHVDACRKPSTTLDLSLPALQTPCQHVCASRDCLTMAEPLVLKNSVLNSLQMSNDVKQSIWLLATETAGPLVQRISKHVMVVKCKINQHHPLGFLHFMLYDLVKGRGAAPEHKFNCSCQTFKTHRIGILRDEQPRRCVHFYACICAFASDERLTEEFDFYISLHTATLSTPEKPLTTICLETLQTPDLLLEQLNDQSLGDMSKKPRKDDKVSLVNIAPAIDIGANVLIRKSQIKLCPAPIDETKVSVSFHQSLASITERINQTMHYQFEGKPDPLVFHLPQAFFECLQQRISTGFKKKRLPNSTTAFVRKDALPIGTFSKYSWHITNVLHVKQIFDTAEIPLDITRNFIQNRDGTYDLFETPRNCLDGGDSSRKAESQLSIRPFELKTFLKVGNTSPDQKEPTPFIIEWIPDILPKMRIGELRLKFEFGHQRNGQIELRFGGQHQVPQLDPFLN